jgi:hypothetical protein
MKKLFISFVTVAMLAISMLAAPILADDEQPEPNPNSAFSIY